MSVVYIDVLFAVNLFLNYIMLLCTGALCRNRPFFWRTLAGAGLGAVYAIAVFFPSLSLFYSVFFKLLASMLIIAAAFPIYGIWSFFKLLAVFYGVNAVFGGLSFALCFLSGWGSALGAVCSNGVMYFDVPMSALLLGAVAFYGFIRLGTAAARLGGRRGARRRVIVELGGKRVLLTALADTGNILVDPISHSPVIVAELETLKELFDRATFFSLFSEDIQEGLGSMARLGFKARLIPFRSVGEGEGLMVGFIPDSVRVREGGVFRPMDCVIGVYPRRLSSDESYNALYNPN